MQKIFQLGARRLETSDATETIGWGTKETDLTGANTIPWLSFDTKNQYGFKEDDSVTGTAFKGKGRLMQKLVDNSLSFYDRYDGIDDVYYWMFGKPRSWDNREIFVVTGVLEGTTNDFNDWTDTDTPPNVFGTWKVEDGKLYIRATHGNTPVGTLTQATSGATFTVESVDRGYYSKSYELDSSKSIRDFTALEIATWNITGDKKRNPYMTFAKKMPDYDINIYNAVATGWTWKLTAGTDGVAQIDVNYKAYSADIVKGGDRTSSTWVTRPEFKNIFTCPAHYETSITIAGTEIDVSEISISVEYPIDGESTTMSGLSIAEPINGSKCDLKLSITKNRHTDTSFLEGLDSQTDYLIKIISKQGNYLKEFQLPSCSLIDAGAGEEDVNKEQIEFTINEPSFWSPITIELLNKTDTNYPDKA